MATAQAPTGYPNAPLGIGLNNQGVPGYGTLPGNLAGTIPSTSVGGHHAPMSTQRMMARPDETLLADSNGEKLSGGGSSTAGYVPRNLSATVTSAQDAAARAAKIDPDQAKLDGYMQQYMASRQAAQQQIQQQAASALALLGQTRNAAASAVATLPAAFQGAYKNATGLLGQSGAAAQGALPPDVQAAVQQAMGPENQYLGATNAAMGSLNPVLNAGISAGANARVGGILQQMMAGEQDLNSQDMGFQQSQIQNQQGFLNQERINKENAKLSQAQQDQQAKDAYAQSAGFSNDKAMQAVTMDPAYKNAVSYLMNGFAQGGNITLDPTKIAQHIIKNPNGDAILRALAANNIIPAAVVKAVSAKG